MDYVGFTGSINTLYVGEGQSMILHCNVTTTGIVGWVDPSGNGISSGCNIISGTRSYVTADCNFVSFPYYVNLIFNETHSSNNDNGTWTCTQTNSKSVNVTLYGKLAVEFNIFLCL